MVTALDEDHHLYHPRRPVHDRRQLVLYVPYVRPEYGTCPSCGAEQDRFCDDACEMSDPLDRDWRHGLRRCLRCSHSQPGTILEASILVLPRSNVLHIAAGEHARCGVHSPRAHRYRTLW